LIFLKFGTCAKFHVTLANTLKFNLPTYRPFHFGPKKPKFYIGNRADVTVTAPEID
jgi:hypothetical protein